MLKQIINKTEPIMKEEVKRFYDELKKVQAGKINPSLVEEFKISYYNSTMPLKTMASIMVAGQNSLLINPWDKGALSTIEASLRESDLGFGINNDGSALRLTLPPLSEDGRQNLIKQISRAAEETRIGLRNVREKAWKEIQESERSGSLSEDDRYRGESELNKLIEKYNKEVAEIAIGKEKEIKTV